MQIDKADRIPEIMSRAWKTAVSGRPGPVVVVVPEDVLSTETITQPLSHPAMVSPAWVGGDTYLTLYEMIEAAERPLILYGGGGLTDAGANMFRPLQRPMPSLLCPFFVAKTNMIT